MARPIPIIINPASGKPQPVLHTLSRVFRAHSMEWNAQITYKFGDARRFAEQAVADGHDLIACFGGDGTVMETVSGVIGSSTTVAILPGGTGNSVARIMGIPLSLEEAVELICRRPNTRSVSLGHVHRQYFILRAHTGITKEQSASREHKDKSHIMAYVNSTVRFVGKTEPVRFDITYDGKKAQVTALSCIVNNLAGWGEIAPVLSRPDPGNGVFDVLFVSKDLHVVGEFASYAIDLKNPTVKAHHISAKEITIHAEPPQPVWMDGEYLGETPVTFCAIPNAVNLLVP